MREYIKKYLKNYILRDSQTEQIFAYVRTHRLIYYMESALPSPSSKSNNSSRMTISMGKRPYTACIDLWFDFGDGRMSILDFASSLQGFDYD